MALAAAEKARTNPDGTALADERQRVTWRDLDPWLNRAANALIAGPGRDGSRIAVFAPNSVENAVTYLAGLHAGVSSVPVNFHFTAEEVAYILRDSGTSVLFVGPETVSVGREAADLAGVETVVAWRSPPTPRVISLEDWLATGEDVPPPTDMAPRPHLHYTSGTTGRPKGTETPPTMFARVPTVAEYFDALKLQFETNGARSPGLVVSPMYHTGPLSSVRLLGGGMSLVIASRFDAEQVLRAIETHGVRTTMMVPTHFQRLLALPPEVRNRYDVSSIEVISHTGAACPREVKRQMIEWFGPVLMEAYGATESGTTNMITSEEWLAKPGSVGKTLAPFELVVVGEDGERLGPNQVGQLYFRDTTGRGIIYHNDETKTRAAHLEPGVFTLGEIGYADDDGYVFITDRSSDMIVSGGVNIYPAETEQVLIQHPGVADVAVIGAPNAEMGEEVKALIVPKDAAAPPASDELNAFCRERLAGFKCPRSYEIVSDIGRNAMGKVNKRELRRKYWPSDRTIGG
jgi:acyl-CoA synthetase (AMP-forming)/AMP-acid ligase II